MSLNFKREVSPEEQKRQLPVCGIVMPISALDGCSESHWADVLAILSDSIEQAGFVSNLVSNGEDIGIIQKRIIQNLNENPVVVCDVSAKNPNVMFELGMRLAFDKPTIIVKDDKTSYSFDTAPIEHLQYPRDLRFSRIVEFKQKLADKIKGTHAKATADPSYTTFLKHFGEFTVAKLDKKEISGQEYILEELQGIRTAMRRLERNQTRARRESPQGDLRAQPVELGGHMLEDICVKDLSAPEIEEALGRARAHPAISNAVTMTHGDHNHLLVEFEAGRWVGREHLLSFLGVPERNGSEH
jgi:hypothetical protein